MGRKIVIIAGQMNPHRARSGSAGPACHKKVPTKYTPSVPPKIHDTPLRTSKKSTLPPYILPEYHA